ncbi:MAG: holin [Cohnella sp.]|jgi:toxin secretion/phage lysis holin|nr:MAG: holin [Cohnella sp.]
MNRNFSNPAGGKGGRAVHPHFGIACVICGSILTFAFGVWPESLTFLLVVMGIDYVSGVAASLREGKGLSSAFGFWGLTKKGLMLLVILLAHRIDVLLGTELAMGGAILFYTANELLSVLENYGRIGLPIPPRLRQAVLILRNRAEGDKKNDASGSGNGPPQS